MKNFEDFKKNNIKLIYVLRFLFMFMWIMEKIFFAIYFIPALVIVIIGWLFVWFPYIWITGKYPTYRHEFNDVAEDTFLDVFETIMCWPRNLLDIFEQYVKLK